MLKKTKYSLGLVFDESMEHILLIHKTYGPFPDKLNGIGGVIEDTDKNVYQAYLREFEEETNLLHGDIVISTHLFTIKYPDVDLLVFGCIVKDPDITKVTQNKEGEVKWYNIDDVNIMDPLNDKIAGYGEMSFFVNYARRILLPQKTFQYVAPKKSTKDLRWDA